MKKQLLVLLILFMTAGSALAQDGTFYLVDVETRENVDFRDIREKYNLNKENPTLIVLWSKKWCGKMCTNLIERYILSDRSKFNLILVNVDFIEADSRIKYENEDALYDDLMYFKKLWNQENVVLFYGYSEKGGINLAMGDSIQNTPHLVYLDKDEKVLFSQASYNFNPNVIFDHLYKENGYSYYRSSPEDVIDHCVAIADIDSLSTDVLSEAFMEIDRSYLLTRNEKFSNFFWIKPSSKDLTEIKFKYYYASALHFYKTDRISVGKTLAEKAFEAVEEGDLTNDKKYTKYIERLRQLKDD